MRAHETDLDRCEHRHQCIGSGVKDKCLTSRNVLLNRVPVRQCHYLEYKMLDFSDIAAVFSSRNINSVSNGDFSLVLNVAKCYQDKFNDTFTVGSVFDFCYSILHKEYRNEYFYKNTIANKILIGRHSAGRSTMFTEFRVGANKADCVIVNGITTCYEIKTDYDNLARLKSQVNSYLKIFDKVNVVVSDKYLASVLESIPHDVGIILLSRRGALREIRAATLIQTPLDTEILMRSLRRDEYVGITKALMGYSPEVNNTEIFRKCSRLIASSDNKKVRQEFRKVIKTTRALDKDFISSLPTSLIVAGLEYSLTRSARVGLIKNMDSILRKETVCTTQYLKASNLS